MSPLASSPDYYRQLLYQVPQAFCIIEVLLDEQQVPVDYYFLEANAAFTEQTGLAYPVGRKVSELTSVTEQQWLDDYGRVARTQQATRLENYHAGTARWYSVYAVPASAQTDRRVAIFFTDITARKQAAQAKQQQVRYDEVLHAQEEERRRIAESLHDGLGQLLYATKLKLDQLPLPAGQPVRIEAERLLSECIQQVRALSHELSPALLEEAGLMTMLTTICQQLSHRQLRWYCHLALEAQQLARPLQLVLYRLAQALSHNVAQHAQASVATLRVLVLKKWVVLRVEDNGRGYDPQAIKEGLGLKTLRSRVALLGGTIQITTAPGRGTQVLVRLPLAPQDGRAANG